MKLKIAQNGLPIVLVIICLLATLPFHTFAATTVTVLDGDVSITDSVGTGTVSGGTVTITATGGFTSRTTNTITITNESDNTATLAFDYSVNNANSHSFDADSGTFSALMDAGASKTFTIQSKALRGIVTLTMSNFSLVAAAESSNVTINYDSSLGSVTAGGSAVASGTTLEVSLADGVTLSATPGSSVSFLGWIDEATNKKLDLVEGKYTPTGDVTIKAAFATSASSAWFLAGGDHLFDDLNAAANYANTAANKTVILMSDGTLAAGNYTIPSGVTLLIPFDDAHTLYTTRPGTTDSYTIPTAKFTFTMDEGAHIAVNGSMSLSAKVSFQDSNSGNKSNLGSPTGDVSMVVMKTGSSIVVNPSGSLYAWGYITGSGTITAKSDTSGGASIYECFQIMDLRGGGQSSETGMSDRKIFPLSQYYVQNIEVPLTLEAGAKEYAFTDVYVRGEQKQTVNFVGSSGCMFNISSGYVTKEYHGDTDRLIIDINGNVNISSVTLTIGQGTLFAQEISSAKYVLALNNNITINVNSGTTTTNQDLALLPGVQVNIGTQGTVKIGSGKSVYVYDVDQWEEFIYSEKYVEYCTNYLKNSALGYSYHEDPVDTVYDNIRIRPVSYAPGRAAGVSRIALSLGEGNPGLGDATICVNGTLDASEGYLYTTSGPMYYVEATDKSSAGDIFENHYNPEFDTSVTYPSYPADLKDYSIDPTLKGGANIYSTASSGKVILISGIVSETYQIIQDSNRKSDSDGDYYIKIPVTLAKLTNGNGDLVTTTAGTYNYHAEHKRWVLGEHTEQSSVVTAPTCTEGGYTTYTCTCGYIYTGSATAATGHTNGTAVRENVVAATCSKAGSYDSVVYCTVCDVEVSREEKTIEKLAHTEVVDVAVAATCTTAGKTEGSHCSVCNTVIVAQTEIPALGHNEVVDAAVAPTCTEAGKTEGKHCSVCSEVLVTQTEVAALGHKYNDGEITTVPMLNVAGKKTFTCSTCGESYEEEFNAAQVGETKYKILSEAIAAAGNDGTVTLLADIDGDVSVNQELTIEKSTFTASIVPAVGYEMVTQDATVTVRKMITLDAFSLDIEGEILLNLKFIIPDWFLNDENAYVQITEQYFGINEDEVREWTVSVTELKAMPKYDSATQTNGRLEEGPRHVEHDKNGRYVFSQGIAAGEMSGNVTVVFFDGEGNDLDVYDPSQDGIEPMAETDQKKGVTRSVLKYAELAIEKAESINITDSSTSDEKKAKALGEMCKAMLTFGAYAQEFYEHRRVDPDEEYVLLDASYKNITETNDAVLSKIKEKRVYGSTDGMTLAGALLDLDSTIDMLVYFEDANSDITFDLYRPRLLDEPYKSGAIQLGSEYLELVNVPPAFWNDLYQIIPSEGSGETCTAKFCVYDWIRGCLTSGTNESEQKMAIAMYNYAEAADVYFALKYGS